MVKVAGYTYYYVTTVGPKTRWRCSTHSSRGCSAHLYTINDTLFATKDEIEFLLSKKGNTMIRYRGYTYHLKETSKSRRKWRCSGHYIHRCHSTIITMGDNVVKVRNEHTHALM
ncbi:hypothetical protein RR46_00739 [Papilio xuthus]|uniref:FLYWCH-type domain-containing protein n=1 Tax=Papilio xuthus TaxID=66420 RepID=A0A0N0PA69_PAPXU|nr:hypothetical protein RR46_00739 [Papilio xuthus]